MRFISATSAPLRSHLGSQPLWATPSSGYAITGGCRGSASAQLGHGIGQDPQTVLALFVGERERWCDSQDIPELAALADEEAVAPARLKRRRCRCGIRRRGAGPAELDSDHQTFATHLGNSGTSRGCLPQPGKQSRALLRCVRLQVVLEDLVEGCEPGPGGERIPAEGGDGVRGQAVHDLAASDDATDGQAVAETLGKGHQIRCEAMSLDTPEMVSGPPPAGLDLIGDEEDPVLVEDGLHRAEKTVRWNGEATHALYWLRDHASNIA